MADPTLIAERFATGLKLQRSGALVESERAYLEVIEADPSHADALESLAALALDRSDFGRAAGFAQASLALRPQAAKLRHLLGRIELARGNLEPALTALEAAIAGDAPDRLEALFDLATCQARRKAWPESLVAARRVLAEVPGHIPSHRIAGHACYSLQRDAEGLGHFEHVLRHDPSQAAVWHASSVMLHRSGHSAAAYQRATKACELSPDNIEYTYQRRVAAAGAVPDWHFNMLHDTARNAAFAASIAACVKPEHLVLEIGTGSGLLSMLAARGGELGGARQVVTCEANGVLAQAATRIVAQNGFADQVKVIHKPSTELAVGVDLPDQADVLIAEIFSVQVITEGVLPTVEDAKKRLLKPHAQIIPARAAARAALVASDVLSRRVRVDRVLGLDLSLLNEFPPVIQHLQPGAPPTLLSDPVDLLVFELAQAAQFPSQKQLIEILVRESGLCQGVLQWLRLELSPGIDFENRPDSAQASESQHWAPVFYPFPQAVQLRSGQSVTVRVSHNRVGLRVELAHVSG